MDAAGVTIASAIQDKHIVCGFKPRCAKQYVTLKHMAPRIPESFLRQGNPSHTPRRTRPSCGASKTNRPISAQPAKREASESPPEEGLVNLFGFQVQGDKTENGDPERCAFIPAPVS